MEYQGGQPGNGEYFAILKLDEINNNLKNILNQLVEINYYLAKAHGDETDVSRVKKLLGK